MKGNEMNWKDFTGSKFLKADEVDNENDAYAVIDITIHEEEDNKRLRLSLQREQKEWVFDLNKTNSSFIQNTGVPNPKDLVGKKIYFRKVLVNNPQTKSEVESLRVCKVEE